VRNSRNWRANIPNDLVSGKALHQIIHGSYIDLEECLAITEIKYFPWMERLSPKQESIEACPRITTGMLNRAISFGSAPPQLETGLLERLAFNWIARQFKQVLLLLIIKQVHKNITIIKMYKEEYYILPPGFCVLDAGYDVSAGEATLRRILKHLENKTICIIKYDYNNREDLQELIEIDYEALKEIGPDEIWTGVWLLKGSKNFLLTAPHASGPKSDIGVGELVYELYQKNDVHALLATHSRKIFDYNWNYCSGKVFYDKIQELIDDGLKFLLDIHSMKKKEGYDIELGTIFYNTAPKESVDMLKEAFELEGYRVAVDVMWTGGTIVQHFGGQIPSIQVEICNELIRKSEMIDALSRFINQVCTQ